MLIWRWSNSSQSHFILQIGSALCHNQCSVNISSTVSEYAKERDWNVDVHMASVQMSGIRVDEAYGGGWFVLVFVWLTALWLDRWWLYSFMIRWWAACWLLVSKSAFLFYILSGLRFWISRIIIKYISVSMFIFCVSNIIFLTKGTFQ